MEMPTRDDQPAWNTDVETPVANPVAGAVHVGNGIYVRVLSVEKQSNPGRFKHVNSSTSKLIN